MTKTILLAAIIAVAAIAPLLTYTSLQNEAEAAPIPTSPAFMSPAVKSACPPEFVQHWDKIIFEVIEIFFPFDSPDGKTELRENIQFDVKVRDNPDELADLKQKTADKLTELGYKLEGTEIPISFASIQIIDVEYSIICAASSDPPIVR